MVRKVSPAARPKSGQPSEPRFDGAVGGAGGRTDEPAFALEEVGAGVFDAERGGITGHGMTADEGDAPRQMLVGPVADLDLGGCGIGDGCAAAQTGGDLLQQLRGRGRRRGEDDEASAVDGLARAADDLVDGVLLVGGVSRGSPIVEADNLGVSQPGGAEAHADGASDVAQPDDCNARHAHLLSASRCIRRSLS